MVKESAVSTASPLAPSASATELLSPPPPALPGSSASVPSASPAPAAGTSEAPSLPSRCSDGDAASRQPTATLLPLSANQAEAASADAAALLAAQQQLAVGEKYLKRELYTEAMGCFTLALRQAHVLGTELAAALYHKRALAELQLDKFELAREDAEDAVDLQPAQSKYD
jgi:tetratricopeptide (TPR) repeat protein